jgi:hypothetical protein
MCAFPVTVLTPPPQQPLQFQAETHFHIRQVFSAPAPPRLRPPSATHTPQKLICCTVGLSLLEGKNTLDSVAFNMLYTKKSYLHRRLNTPNTAGARGSGQDLATHRAWLCSGAGKSMISHVWLPGACNHTAVHLKIDEVLPSLQ